MGGLLHLVQQGGAWVGCGPAPLSSLLAVPNVTARPSVEEWIWHYNCLCTLKGQVNMLCGELR